MFTIYDIETKKYLGLIWCGTGQHKTEDDLAYAGDILHTEGQDVILSPLTFCHKVEAARVASTLTTCLEREFKVEHTELIEEKL